MFVELPEYMSCSFLGANSPVILRAEAGCVAGGMVVEERSETPPHVHLYGDTPAAKQAFRVALAHLAQHAGCRPPAAVPFTVGVDRWFQIEVRLPTAHLCLHGDRRGTKLDWDVVPNGHDAQAAVLRAVYGRLRTLYERFFATTL